MNREVKPRRRATKMPDKPASPGPLFDTRTLLVLICGTSAGLFAGREGGWTAGVTVGIATVIGLHTLLRR